MTDLPHNPRILFVTPEVTYLPEGMGSVSNGFCAKAGGLADVSAALISALFQQGADVHVTLPDYRAIFGTRFEFLILSALKTIKRSIPEERIHLAEDKGFFQLRSVYSNYGGENSRLALAFQKEVINNIVPRVRPDLIHCNDWMTGLIPAVARQLNIPCLFTIHNIYTVRASLSDIEDRGIDAASFRHQLFFDHTPKSDEDARTTAMVDFLASGVFASHFVSTVSPTFLKEMVEGRHAFVKGYLRRELAKKVEAGCAVGILNAPDPSYNTTKDNALVCRYHADDHVDAKKKNKDFVQGALGLTKDVSAPLFFWPSRLDTVQKGCQLLAKILYNVITKYQREKLQVIFVADGEFQGHFKDIVRFHRLFDRVGICGFDERLARLGYAASDFVLMPSRFEPCGLPQMIGPLYGALPIVHDTGGLHDTIEMLDLKNNRGNGFLFRTYDSNGLFRAIDQAMHFYNHPGKRREQQIRRIMKQSAETFNHAVTARQYMDLYEKMLKRPLIMREKVEGDGSWC